jgi:hypothetical protein
MSIHLGGSFNYVFYPLVKLMIEEKVSKSNLDAS